MSVFGFRSGAYTAGLLAVAIAGIVHAQTYNGPGPVSPDPGTRAAIIGEPVVTGTQTVAPVGGCSRVDINFSGTVSGTTDDGGGLDQVVLEIWDDGSMVASTTFSVPVGSSVDVDVDASFEGLYATGAAGVGVYVVDAPGTASIYTEDPFIPTDVAGTCGGGEPAPARPVPGPGGVVLLLLGAALGGFGLRRLRAHKS